MSTNLFASTELKGKIRDHSDPQSGNYGVRHPILRPRPPSTCTKIAQPNNFNIKWSIYQMATRLPEDKDIVLRRPDIIIDHHLSKP